MTISPFHRLTRIAAAFAIATLGLGTALAADPPSPNTGPGSKARQLMLAQAIDKLANASDLLGKIANQELTDKQKNKLLVKAQKNIDAALCYAEEAWYVLAQLVGESVGS